MAIRQGRYYAVASTAMRGPSYDAYSLEATPTGLRSPARYVLEFVDLLPLGVLGNTICTIVLGSLRSIIRQFTAVERRLQVVYGSACLNGKTDYISLDACSTVLHFEAESGMCL